MTTQQDTLLRRISLGLCAIGIFISSYLTWAHFAAQKVLCLGGSQGCDIVQQSSYSVVAGIPVAVFGLLGYLAIAGLLIVETRKGALAEQAPLLIFGMTLVGVGYSAYLTYLELFVILAICQYCVASAIVMLALFVIAIYRVIRPASA